MSPCNNDFDSRLMPETRWRVDVKNCAKSTAFVAELISLLGDAIHVKVSWSRVGIDKRVQQFVFKIRCHFEFVY